MGRNRRSKEFKNNSQVIDMEEARQQRQEKRQAEKARREEKERDAKRRNTRGKRAIRRSKTRRRVISGIVIAALLGLLSFVVFNIVSLQKEKYDALQKQEALKQEKADLENEIENAAGAENIEAQARDQLRLIKPGETLYMFSDDMTDTDDDTDTEQESGE